jgi:hypothetical protein
MNDAFGVRSGETFCKSGSNVHSLTPCQRAARQERSQGLAFQQLGDSVAGTFLGSRVEDYQDIGMRERCQGLMFAEESRHSLRVLRKMLRQDLDGNIAVKPNVACFIDFTHPPSTNWRDYFVGAEFVTGREGHMNDSA